MAKLLKLTAVAVLFMLLSTGITNAAFPTVKETKQATTATVTATTTTQEVTTIKAAKRELKAAAAGAKGKYFGGGKHKLAAVLFAVFLGVFGVHSFYMGQTGKGFVQLGLGVVGLGLYIAGYASYLSSGGTLPAYALIGFLIYFGVAIWAFVDFIRILSGSLEPEEGFDD